MCHQARLVRRSTQTLAKSSQKGRKLKILISKKCAKAKSCKASVRVCVHVRVFVDCQLLIPCNLIKIAIACLRSAHYLFLVFFVLLRCLMCNFNSIINNFYTQKHAEYCAHMCSIPFRVQQTLPRGICIHRRRFPWYKTRRAHFRSVYLSFIRITLLATQLKSV